MVSVSQVWEQKGKFERKTKGRLVLAYPICTRKMLREKKKHIQKARKSSYYILFQNDMACMFARGTGSLVFLDEVTVEATG